MAGLTITAFAVLGKVPLYRETAILAAIVDDLAATFTADWTRIDADVRAMLADLAAKKMLLL